MEISKAGWIVAASLTLAAHAAVAEPPQHWRDQGLADLQRQLQELPKQGTARNVILFVGDGMGISTVTAARILEGQQRGERGEENSLYFETLPYASLIKTYNTNQQTPDSSGTMTAMVTGVKTKAGLVSVDDNALRGDCASTKGNELKTFLEEAEEAGLATGVVTTTRLTHATPAAAYAHVPERDWEDDATVPDEQEVAGCVDIARQLIEFPYGDGIEVAMGGGRRHFLPESQADPEDPDDSGDRRDGRHLGEEWVKRFGEGSAWIWNQAQFDAIDPAQTTHLLALFNESHMQYEHDRAANAAEPAANPDEAGEPSLTEMTRKAIAILGKNPKGFVLIVEGGRIDHGHHASNAYRALTDTIEFARAVEAADDLTGDDETLILVTADHGHVFTIGGYPTRGNPILGFAVGNDGAGAAKHEPALADDDRPYTTVAYANGHGGGFLDPSISGDGTNAIYREPIRAGRRGLKASVDPTAPNYHQESGIPLVAETHSGEDIPLYAKGPWAHLFRRTHEQSYLYYVMKHAAKLSAR